VTAVDRKLIERIWEWLSVHPDVWIGENREGNSISFSEAENRESRGSELVVSDGRLPSTVDTNGDSSQSDNNISSLRGADISRIVTQTNTTLRIYTTQSRIWQALAGHAVDFKRIPTMEFQLLLVIAAAGPLGINQPDLVRSSGQDKRSVPKRTEELHSKGYIVKKSVYEKGMKTSLLILKRFLSPASESKRDSENPTGTSANDLRDSVFVDGRLILDNFLEFLVQALGNKAVPMDNLILDMGIRNKKWERGAVYRCLERLDIIGIISRFRTTGNVSANDNRQIRSIRLLRRPTDEDRLRYHALTNELRTKFRESLEVQDAIRRGNEEVSNIPGLEHTGEDGPDSSVERMEDIHTVVLPLMNSTAGLNSCNTSEKRTLATWDPDLPYPTILFNAIHPRGKEGLTSMDATKTTYGEFYTRSVDSMLGRLTDEWEISQPQHLIHLALIRDTALVSRANHYLYRSYPNFQKAVESGDAEWDAVRTKIGNLAASRSPKLDQWGFPVVRSGGLFRADGTATLSDSIKAAEKEKSRERDHGDGEPILETDANGNDTIVWPQVGKGRKRKRMGSDDSTPYSVHSPQMHFGTTSRPARSSMVPSTQQSLTQGSGKKYIYPRPETVKGMTWSEYNRQYNEKKRQEKLAAQRMERIRRHAEWLVGREGLLQDQQVSPPQVENGTNNAQPDSAHSSIQITSSSKRRPMSSGEEVPRKKQKTRHETETLFSNDEPQGSPLAGSRRQRANAAQRRRQQDRLEELIAELSDTTRTGLHYDPPGSRPHLDQPSIGRRRNGLIAVFKFPWLRSMDWFERDPGTHYIPREPSTARRNNAVLEEVDVHEADAASSQLLAEIAAAAQGQAVSTEREPNQQIVVRPPEHIQPDQATDAPNHERLPSADEWFIDFKDGFELFIRGEDSNPDDVELLSIARRPCGVSNKVRKRKRKRRPAKRRKVSSWSLDIQAMESARFYPPEPKSVSDSVKQHSVEDNDQSVMGDIEPREDVQQVETHESMLPNPAPSTSNIPQTEETTRDGVDIDAPQRGDDYSLREHITDSRARRKRGVGLGGGSSRAKRINLILDIVNKCGGVFGGDTEIIRPFQDTQLAQNKDADKAQGKVTLTDRDTILKALKASVSDGKLKRAAWVFVDQNGFAVTKKLLLRPDMKFDDPVAVEFRKKIEEIYPVQYIPDFLLVRKRGGIEKPQAKVISRYLMIGDEEEGAEEIEEAQWVTDHRRRQAEMEKRREEKRLQRMRDWWHGNKNQVPKTQRGRLQKLVRQQTREVAVSFRRESNDGNGTKTRGEGLADVDPNEVATLQSETQDTPGTAVFDVSASPNLVSSTIASWPANDSLGMESATALIYEVPFQWEQSASSVHGPSQQRVGTLSESLLQAAQASGGRRLLAPRPTGTTLPQLPRQSAYAHQGSKFLQSRIIPKIPNERLGSSNARALLMPTQGFHSPTGTYSTDFNVTSRIKSRLGKLSMTSVPSSKTSSQHNGKMFEDLEAWRKEGYNMRLVTSGDISTQALGSEENFVNYIVDHSEVTEMNTIQTPGQRSGYRPGDHFTIYGAPNQAPPPGITLGPPPNPFQMSGIRRPSDLLRSVAQANSVGQYTPLPVTRSTALSSYTAQEGAFEIEQPPGIPWIPAKPQQTVSKFKVWSAQKTPHSAGNAKSKQGDPTCFITPVAAKRLLFSIIAIRTLAGGPAQTIHWPIVCRLFKDYANFDETSFRKRWAIMLQYHRDVIARVESTFQSAFLAAYEKDEVPRLNNEHPEDYDWEGIVKWAGENVMIDSRDTELPTIREEFEKRFVMEQDEDRVETEVATRESMYREISTMILREQIMNELRFCVELTSSRTDVNQKTVEKDGFGSAEMELAKSWARASIATPENYYDAASAHAKLRRLGDPLLTMAIQQLQESKIIVQTYRGREKPTGGRNYHLAEHYNTANSKKCIFIRQLQREHFVEAITFKKKLDSIFAAKKEEDRVYVVPDLVSDGEILCITELMAHGRIQIIPRLSPKNNNSGHPLPKISVWGLGKKAHYANGKYADMKLLRWPVEIHPTASFVMGFSIVSALQKVHIPMAPKGDGNDVERIPYWVDIHGNFLRENWENMVTTVAYLIAVRAGSTIDSLQVSFKGLIWSWEIEMVLQWLVEIGVARWIEGSTDVHLRSNTTKSVTAKEWWWTVLQDSS